MTGNRTVNAGFSPDGDGDGVADGSDNCPLVSNPGQANFDNDSRGNACDSDDDNDSLPDSWETANGLNPRNAADASQDADNDGFTNLQEFEFGTDPNQFDPDNNNNNIPDIYEAKRAIPAMLHIILGE
jgi:hypothetical protein